MRPRLAVVLVAAVMRPRLAVVLVAAVMLIALLPAARAATGDAAAVGEPSPEFVMHEEYFPSLDGTELHAYVYRPTWVGDAPTPVQLVITPYGSSGPAGEPGDYDGGTLGYGPRTFLEGYTAVSVSLRGHGGSRGCTDLGGPLEQGDARAAVEWARLQPWSNGKVAVTGLSYVGLATLMTLALRDDSYQGPDAIVFAAAPTGYEQFWENGVPQMLFGQLPHGWGVLYHAYNVIPPSPQSDLRQHQNNALGYTDTPSCDPIGTFAGNTNPDPNTPYWDARDMVRATRGATVPVLAYQGFDDTGVPAKQLFPVLEGLAGPWRALIGPWPHHPPGSREVTGEDLVYGWLNHHLRGEPLPEAPRWMVQTLDGAWRGEEAWPPSDAQPYELPLLPGAYLDMHGNQSDNEPPENVARILSLPDFENPVHGVGSWTFSQPVPHQAHLSGQPVMSVRLHARLPGAHVIALLYEIEPDGTAQLITRGAATVPSGGEAADVTFQLRPQDWKLAPGSRIGVLVTGADDWYYGSGKTGQPVQILGGALSLPLLRHDRSPEEQPVDAGPFRPWTRPAGFPVDGATIAARTADAPPPPAQVARPQGCCSPPPAADPDPETSAPGRSGDRPADPPGHGGPPSEPDGPGRGKPIAASHQVPGVAPELAAASLVTALVALATRARRRWRSS